MESNAIPLIVEILEYKKQLWQNNQFCNCGADNLRECQCPSDKKKRFLRRRKKKVNKKFSDALDNGLKAEIQSQGDTGVS